MSDWVADLGVLKLRSQVDEAAPKRRRDSDGFKGDDAHAARTSDHNPEEPPPPGNPHNQVDAVDLTHDPANGADMGVVTESIRRSRDRRVKFVIFNGRMFASYARIGRKAWEWGPYDGSDRHEGHAHISVNDEHHDETQNWEIGIDMADSVGAVAAHWRQLAVLMLDPAYAARPEITEQARLKSVPLIDLLERLDENVTSIKGAVADEGLPIQVVLSTDQLDTIITEVSRRVIDAMVTRVRTLKFEVQE